MNLLLSSLLVAAAPAQEPPPPPLAYMDAARVEIEAATDAVEAWLAAAERRGDVDERMCLRSKLAPLQSYLTVVADTARASKDHLAANDTVAVALDVRQAGAALERARSTYDKARACLVDTSPTLSTFEDPEIWRILPVPELEEYGGCGDDDTSLAVGSPC